PDRTHKSTAFRRTCARGSSVRVLAAAAGQVPPLQTLHPPRCDVVPVDLDDLVALPRKGVGAGVAQDAEADGGDLRACELVFEEHPAPCMSGFERGPPE